MSCIENCENLTHRDRNFTCFVRARALCILLEEKTKTDSNMETEINTLLRSVMFPTMEIDGANRLIIRRKLVCILQLLFVSKIKREWWAA
jgi:hypothetical protein